MKRSILACRASPKGVLVIDGPRGRNVFHPNRRRIPPRDGDFSEDEQFIRYCLLGLKYLTVAEIQSLPPERMREIDTLHKRAMTVIVKLKEEVARNWSRAILKPFLNKALSGTERVSELVIDDIRDVQLDISIPRPILIHELMKLRGQFMSKKKA